MRGVSTNAHNFIQHKEQSVQLYESKATPGFKHKLGSSSYATISQAGTINGTAFLNSNVKSISNHRPGESINLSGIALSGSENGRQNKIVAKHLGAKAL